MTFSDPLMHAQLNFFVESARQAVAAETAVSVVGGFDEETQTNGHLVMFDNKDETLNFNGMTAEVVAALLSAAATILESVDTQVWVKTADGDLRQFRVADPSELQFVAPE